VRDYLDGLSNASIGILAQRLLEEMGVPMAPAVEHGHRRASLQDLGRSVGALSEGGEAGLARQQAAALSVCSLHAKLETDGTSQLIGLVCRSAPTEPRCA